jgi:hypothetical protein
MAGQSDSQLAIENYRSTSRELMLKGEQALEEGDLLQASEKFWRASAHMVKALAQSRGWEHSTHRALFNVVDRLASEMADDELRSLFLEAGQLHTNFYENWLPLEMVRRGGERIKELLQRLEQAL